MTKNLWSIKLNSQPGIVRWDLGPHFSFWDANDDDGMPPMPLFSSPHVNILNEGEDTRACMRLKTLMRLANGISLITRGEPIHYLDVFYQHKDNMIKPAYWDHDSSIMIEELIYPFDENVIQCVESNTTKTRKTRTIDYAELVVKDNLVQEVVLLLTLAMEDELYLLINSYKILEIIRNDMGFKVNDGKLVENDVSEKYTVEKIFELQGLAGYINNKGASGIFSRHGFSKKETKLEAPSYNTIVDIIIIAISEWMNYKCHVKFDRLYEPSKGRLDLYKNLDSCFNDF
ncbi:hypothetical protein [Bacillus pseudomycoides]|uniref:hypothetical protein n=1 Tax=Bacillus pseudomycoides TaxID=64104 RepID=UPI0002FE8C6D|nr:hypothetical protein [Bacillus pseudomycoides]